MTDVFVIMEHERWESPRTLDIADSLATARRIVAEHLEKMSYGRTQYPGSSADVLARAFMPDRPGAESYRLDSGEDDVNPADPYRFISITSWTVRR